MPRKDFEKGHRPDRADGKARVSTEQHVKAVYEIRSMLELGYTTDVIRDTLVDHYGYTPAWAEKKVKTEKHNFEEYYERVAENLADTNLKRLNSLIYKLTAKGDDKLVLQAIDLLNKQIGAYEHKVKVTSENPIFEIKVGDDE